VIKNVTRILDLFFGFLVLGMKAGLGGHGCRRLGVE
jgi:hypothetical protein